MSGATRRIAVLGDMAELGSLTELAHFRLGEQVARLAVDVLVTVGPRAVRIGEGATAEGMSADRVRICSEAPEALEVLDDLLASGDAVLVKASRVMGLESVVEGIVSPR
jgi:UDP-N-acetylmuramoyl-tripeptide--D-alanyl-D-alanine ligase